MAAKSELLRFLESNVFHPILRARPDQYNLRERKLLSNVQRVTLSEKSRFQKYQTVEEIVENFKRDLHSEAAKRLDGDLQLLRMPRLIDVKDQFLELAGDAEGAQWNDADREGTARTHKATGGAE